MAKALLINGSPREFGCTYTALSELKGKLEQHGIEADILYLGKQAISGCTACRYCYTHDGCVIDDAVNRVSAMIDEYDALVVGAPVHYAGPSAQVCAFMDRLFYSGAHKMRGKAAAAVVSCRRGGATAAFDRLNKYFTISNMIVVGSQYWTMVHGNTPDEVRQDLEGMQILRTLGENMAWLIKCIEAGRRAGIPRPEYEKRVATNFIR